MGELPVPGAVRTIQYQRDASRFPDAIQEGHKPLVHLVYMAGRGASPELRSKKALIESFIAGINDVSDVMVEWRQYVAEEKERQLVQLIQEENLKEEETRKFIEVAFRDGSVKTTGTDIDKLMPPMSRFGGGNRAEKKQGVIKKLLTFFERFFGIG